MSIIDILYMLLYIYIYICFYTFLFIYIYICFPGNSVVKNLPANAEDTGRTSGRGNGNPTPIFLPGKSHG